MGEEELGVRLARIEQSQQHMSRQLDRVVTLLDRMVRVEEHIEEHRKVMEAISAELREVRKIADDQRVELEKIKAERKMLFWVIGTLVSLAGGGAAIGFLF